MTMLVVLPTPTVPHDPVRRRGQPGDRKPRYAVLRCLDASGGTGAIKSAAEVNDPRSGRVPAGAPSAGFVLLLVLAMAQFMVVLDNTHTCANPTGGRQTPLG